MSQLSETPKQIFKETNQLYEKVFESVWIWVFVVSVDGPFLQIVEQPKQVTLTCPVLSETTDCWV